ncbi:hypothetical protein MMC22_010137 [Lobaria immixta]|nr:hypothetical protein [Lobaria immixta]
MAPWSIRVGVEIFEHSVEWNATIRTRSGRCLRDSSHGQLADEGEYVTVLANGFDRRVLVIVLLLWAVSTNVVVSSLEFSRGRQLHIKQGDRLSAEQDHAREHTGSGTTIKDQGSRIKLSGWRRAEEWRGVRYDLRKEEKREKKKKKGEEEEGRGEKETEEEQKEKVKEKVKEKEKEKVKAKKNELEVVNLRQSAGVLANQTIIMTHWTHSARRL